MANEIDLQFSVRIDNDEFQFQYSDQDQLDQTGTGGGNPGVIDVTPSAQVISLGDISSAGFAVFKNLDATWTIFIGAQNEGESAEFLELPPGVAMPCYLKGNVVLMVRSDAASGVQRLQVHVFER